MLPRKSTAIVTGEVRQAWLQREGDRWVRLHAHEEDALDTAVAAGRFRVPLSGGRRDAHLWRCQEKGSQWAGEAIPRYGGCETMPMARSRWCYRPLEKGARWTPFAPSDEAALEERLQEVLQLHQLVVSSAIAAAASSALPPMAALALLDGTHTVQLNTDTKGNVHAEMRAAEANWLSKAKEAFSSPYAVSRGWAGKRLRPLSEAEILTEAAPPSALVLVVHGIGESLWRHGDNAFGLTGIEHSVSRLRALAAKAAVAASDDTGGPGGATTASQPLRRVEFLAVSWHTGARTDERAAATVATLSRVTLPSIPGIRQFANEVISDVLLYEQPAHKAVIQGLVVQRIEELRNTWCAHHPTFSGPVIVCGHSLGSLIAFDILSPPLPLPTAEQPASTTAATRPSATVARLSAPVSALVALGSPIGFFVAMRGVHLGAAFTLAPSCARFFNVFARNDPVAYRVEPLLLPRPDTAVAEDAAESTGSGDSVGGQGSGQGGTTAHGECSSDEEGGEDERTAWQGRTGGSDGRGSECGATSAHDGARRRWHLAGEVVMDAPPPYVPFAGNRRSALRMHIKLRQDLQNVVMQAVQVQQAASAAGKSVQTWSKSALTNPAHAVKGVASTVQSWLGKVPETSASTANSVDDRATAGRASTKSSGEYAAGFAINGGERVDWLLQESELESVQEYWAALQAHSNYFENEDVAAFIVNEVVGCCEAARGLQHPDPHCVD